MAHLVNTQGLDATSAIRKDTERSINHLRIVTNNRSNHRVNPASEKIKKNHIFATREKAFAVCFAQQLRAIRSWSNY
jgi:hypothetical protein